MSGTGSRPQIICLTPVKNEAWILDLFLRCASIWADRIIIADQGSDDGSAEIAHRFPKANIVRNAGASYDEWQRQRLLIDEARKIPGPRVLVALDADEVMSANLRDCPAWHKALAAPPGTVVQFPYVNVLPDRGLFWRVPDNRPLGYVDDGREHVGRDIHSPRVPVYRRCPTVTIESAVVMHYQYADWERMESKHRWYQCWERINHPERTGVSIYRQYHHMYSIGPDDLSPLPGEWLAGYTASGIDTNSFVKEQPYRWDAAVVELIDKYGADHFSDIAIWDQDWTDVAHSIGYVDVSRFSDPRTRDQRALQDRLARTQAFASRPGVRLLDALATVSQLRTRKKAPLAQTPGRRP